MAGRLLLLALVVAAASVLVASPVADARPCYTFLISSSSANANPSNDPDHRAPLTTTVITVFRVRRFGPHLFRAHDHAQPHLNHHQNHHLHSIPANIQIRHPELPVLPHSTAVAAASTQDRFIGILMVLVGILTAASVYLVWSVISGTGALSHYDEEDDEQTKKFGYVIISSEAHGGGKN